MLLASVASAAPAAEWTLPPLPFDWKDVTETRLQEPALVAQRKQILDAGGTFAATIYQSDSGAGGLMVFTTELDKTGTSMSELEAFVAGFRASTVTEGKEVSWNLERTPAMLVGTQQVLIRDVPGTITTYFGFLQTGSLRTISFMCFSDPERCPPLLANASVDSSRLQRLATLDNGTTTAYRIGVLVGSVLVVLVVVGLLWKRRPRAAK